MDNLCGNEHCQHPKLEHAEDGSCYHLTDHAEDGSRYHLTDKKHKTICLCSQFTDNVLVDKVVAAVRADLLNRSQFGIKKYGVTLERRDLKLIDWLEHTYTETLDTANYLKRTIMELRGQL